MSKRASIGIFRPDLQFTNAGSFATCVPMTDAGRDWLEENVGPPPPYSDVHVIEFRYLEDIVTGARADGLICEG